MYILSSLEWRQNIAAYQLIGAPISPQWAACKEEHIIPYAYLYKKE